jgi:hypothetical protein
MQARLIKRILLDCAGPAPQALLGCVLFVGFGEEQHRVGTFERYRLIASGALFHTVDFDLYLEDVVQVEDVSHVGVLDSRRVLNLLLHVPLPSEYVQDVVKRPIYAEVEGSPNKIAFGTADVYYPEFQRLRVKMYGVKSIALW